MLKKRKYGRLCLITFAESEVFAVEILDKSDIKREDLIPQSFFMVYNRDDGNVIGHLIDISIGGLLLIVCKPFEIDAIYSLSMDFTSVLDKERWL